MQKFYIHKDEQQQGPFTIEELKGMKITRDTMIWYEGINNWKKASELEELKDVVKSIPPPINSMSFATPPKLNNESNKKSEIISVKKIIIIVVTFILIGFSVNFFVQQKVKQQELEKKIEIQNAKILEQEYIETARRAEEERKNQAKRMKNLMSDYDQAITSLREAKIKLSEVEQFQLLRTEDEKKEQIREQLEIIRNLENEIERLEKEIKKNE